MQINFKFQIREYLSFIIGHWSFIGLLVIGLLAYFPKVALAQTFSLGIYPPLLEVMIMPGKSVSQNYELVNSGDQTEITAQIIPFEPKGELGQISLGGSTSREVEPQKGWFSFENTDLILNQPFTLKPGETKQIILKIKIPQKAEEDDYYFSLLFASLPQGRLGFSGAAQAGVIGTNILITVSKTGQPIKKGEIIQFLISNSLISNFPFSIIDSFQKPDFLLRVKNTGRAFWKPFGKIKTEGLLGQKWEQELLPDNILANSLRQINVATPSALPAFLIGPYRTKVEFTPDEEGLRPGGPQGPEGQTLSAATSFLALPIKAGFGILTSIIVFFMIKSIISKSKNLTRRGR